MNCNIKEIRKKNKLTQKQLAEYLDVDQSLICRIEKGERTLNMALVEKICNLFNCTPEDVFGENDVSVFMKFSFKANKLQKEDLEAIAAVNKIIKNIRCLNSFSETIT